jgi:hypothetical protein
MSMAGTGNGFVPAIALDATKQRVNSSPEKPVNSDLNRKSAPGGAAIVNIR